MSKIRQDQTIGKMFDEGYKSEPKPAVVDNFDSSVRFYFDYITSKNVGSVLDVGMGAGGLLLALQNHGIKHVYGVELSHEGVELATKRFELYGDIDHAEFFEGNIVDYSPGDVDVITLHRVLHCHPDYQAIIQKSIEIGPRYIIYTLPRDILLARIFIGFISLLSRPITGFRAYVHPTDAIHEMLGTAYTLEDHHHSRFWETSVYVRKD